MARRLVGHPQHELAERRIPRDGGEIFRDVAHLRGERGGALTPYDVVREQVSVQLELRAAAGRVDDDGVEGGALERLDVPFRERQRLVVRARMRVQRTT